MENNPSGSTGAAAATAPTQPLGNTSATSTSSADLPATAAQAGDQVKAQAQQALDQAQQVAGQVLDQARGQIMAQAEDKKNAAAESLGSVATAFRKAGDHLRSENQASIAPYMDRAAEQVEQFTTFFRDKNVDEIIGEAEDFARREPALFLGAGIVLGILASRFLKSSSVEARRARYQAYSPSRDLSPYIQRSGYSQTGYSQTGYSQGGFTQERVSNGS